jgi:hypothetical protein
MYVVISVGDSIGRPRPASGGDLIASVGPRRGLVVLQLVFSEYLFCQLLGGGHDGPTGPIVAHDEVESVSFH